MKTNLTNLFIKQSCKVWILFVFLFGWKSFKTLESAFDLHKRVPDIQALFNAERRGDTFTSRDEGSCCKTHHHVLRLHLQYKKSKIRKSAGQEQQQIHNVHQFP